MDRNIRQELPDGVHRIRRKEVLRHRYCAHGVFVAVSEQRVQDDQQGKNGHSEVIGQCCGRLRKPLFSIYIGKSSAEFDKLSGHPVSPAFFNNGHTFQ